MHDFFRDFPGRWLGYAHVVGQALPSEMIPPMGKLWMTRTSMAYIAFDTVYKSMDSRQANFLLKGADALIWQSLASVLLPGAVLQGVTRGSALLVDGLKISKPMNRYLPIGLVVLAIPLCGKAVDGVVDTVLDHTTRPIMLR